ncbi:MAG: GNAT family N-acetyltransferase [Verrucomicrobia bacterium]|nr:GNAT family N-acetyltransferase [Verrucomicrobiota bacterium]
MKTYFLGKEETNAYLLDFLGRLQEIKPIPTVWCPVTESGAELLRALLGLIPEKYPELLSQTVVFPIEVENGSENIRFSKGDPAPAIRGKSVLLLDGAIHSGRMMSKCAEEILRHGPEELSSYSLFVKQHSIFIPTIWGVMIDEADRAYFLLNKIPNNRLNAGKKGQLPLQIQRLDSKHLSQPPIVSNVKSMDRMTWGDRLFQMKVTDGTTCTYVLERTGQIVGFLTVHPFDGSGGLSIDEVVVDSKAQAHGYGGVLVRFADTLARQSNHRLVRLNAIKEKTGFYEKFGYQQVSGAETIKLDDEEYQPMERKVLYHQAPAR